MTTESKCPHCGTKYSPTPRESTLGRHDVRACRDILHAQLTKVTRQRDEAIRIAFLALPTNSPLLDELEVLRGK